MCIYDPRTEAEYAGRELLKTLPRVTREMKLERAKQLLGTKWILHPTNRVQRKELRRA